MTQPTPGNGPPSASPPDPESRTVRVLPTAQSRLAGYLALYDSASAEFEAAKERLEAVKTAIKNEAIQAALSASPEGQLVSTEPRNRDRVIVDLPGVLRQPLSIGYKVVRSIDPSALRRDHPDIANAYTVARGRWELRGL